MPGPEVGSASSPLVSALLSGAAPRALKVSAARGVLPMLRAELLRILVVLAGDGDEEIRKEAVARLGAFPEDEIRPMLEDPAAPAEVLDHFGSDPRTPAPLREMVVANPATSADTLRKMIPGLSAAHVDLILLNQTRIIAHPDLLDSIEEAGLPLSPLQRSRIAEIRRHFLRAPAAAPPFAAPPAPEPAIDPEPEIPAAGTAHATAHAIASPEPAAGTDGAAQAAMVANAMQKILKLNTAEKVQLAFKGSREERSILIKDSSKLVQEAVLDSPKLTENEVESISRMRTIGEDVLRIIAGNRDWMKNYAIVHALTANPKTPAGIALNLVNRLTSHDLKMLCTDKNVPEVIRRQARKITDSRTQRPRHH